VISEWSGNVSDRPTGHGFHKNTRTMKPRRTILIVFRTTAFVVAASFIVAISTYEAKAEAWGTNAAAAILKEVLERTQRVIDGVILSSTKMAATSVLNSQVASLIGGSSLGESGIVTDWEKYLYQEPVEETRVYMDSYLTAVTGGRAASNYRSAGSSEYSYNSYLKSYAEGMLATTSDGDIVAANAEEQIPDFQKKLADGDIQAYNVYFQGANNPFSLSLMARSQEQQVYESLKDTQQTKAIAYGGYKGTTAEDGKTIITPGSTVRDVVSNVYGIGPNIIATSSNPSELTSGTVLAAVNSAIMKLFQNGLGSVRSNIEREISSVSGQVNRQLQGVVDNSGTLRQFTPSVQQQAGISPNATADPSASIPVEVHGYR